MTSLILSSSWHVTYLWNFDLYQWTLLWIIVENSCRVCFNTTHYSTHVIHLDLWFTIFCPCEWQQLLQPLGCDFQWKKVSAVMTLFRTVGIRLFCKCKPSVLFYNASGFIISVYNSTLWFAIRPFPVNNYLMWLTVLASDVSTSWKSMPDFRLYSPTALCSLCFDSMRDNGNWGRRGRN